MPRVFSPLGFNVEFTHWHLVLNHGFNGLEDFTDYRGRCRDAMLRVFSPTGFNVEFTHWHLVLNHGFKGFTGFHGLQRTSSVLK